MQREVIAFFDVDHTITRYSTSVSFILVCIKRGFIKWWYLLAAPILFIMYRFFNVKMEALFRYSLPKLYGIERTVFEEMAKTAFNRYQKKNIYPGALREIELLRKRGVRVMFASSSPFEVVYPLAQYCGITATDIIATQFSYNHGVFEGKLLGVPVFSRYKSSIIKGFVEKSGTDIQLCSFYTDSVHDLPLLELVGHPVAANPDARLRRIARKRGWTIKDFSK